METNNKTIEFRRKFGNYANPSFRKIVKKRTLETANLNKQNKHRSLILMKHRSVTFSKASILFPQEMLRLDSQRINENACVIRRSLPMMLCE